MSGSNRDEGSTSVDWTFPLIGMLLAIFLAWGVGYLQARETERRYQTPQAYQEGAKASAQRACGDLEPAAMFECINEHVEASNEQANAEQDLSAQQRAASSALVAAIIAFATLVVTGIGVWLVKRTLEATLDAVRDTSIATRAMIRQNELTEQSQRPWVLLETVIIQRYANGMWSMAVQVKNFGSSIAKDVKVIINWKASKVPSANIPHTFDLKSLGDLSAVIAPGNSVRSHAIDRTYEALISEWVSIICRVEYLSETGVSCQTQFRIGVKCFEFADNEVAPRWEHLGEVIAT